MHAEATVLFRYACSPLVFSARFLPRSHFPKSFNNLCFFSFGIRYILLLALEKSQSIQMKRKQSSGASRREMITATLAHKSLRTGLYSSSYLSNL